MATDVPALTRSDLEALWLPFTANRQFKAAPRLLARASGMYYWTPEGRQILDAVAGLWCVNAGHGRREITQAVASQLETLDFAPTFQMPHPAAFQLANELVKIAPSGLDHAFFTNSGSEAVDTALKIAVAFHRVRGEGTRTRLIGRERAYHGVGFGGISVGGMTPNRKTWSAVLLPGVDHLPHTHDLARNAFSRGAPQHGAQSADELERLVTLHDASNIAAVIVEPIAGSTGVLIPPRGYLERLREICDRHGILLIFDEVITGFGRTGSAFAAQEFGVTPDMITLAKGLTNGCVPMGGVLVSKAVYEAFMQGPDGIELFHGYTYSAHPAACAGGLATLALYQREGLLTRAASLAKYWEEAAHALRGLPHVVDVRNYGLILGLELESIPGNVGTRGFEVFKRCFDRGVLVRQTGDVIALSPPLIVEKTHIDQIFGTLSEVLRAQ
ncbi:MAG TPA: aspartate aminotransferase family protein [Steroidobacteraceae bacterium]|nr:aspartate aminotransferase family protein [Steroidobacteraceae bacterium]